jgi:hypothetical protein
VEALDNANAKGRRVSGKGKVRKRRILESLDHCNDLRDQRSGRRVSSGRVRERRMNLAWRLWERSFMVSIRAI